MSRAAHAKAPARATPDVARPAATTPVPDILRALGDEHKYQVRLLRLLEKQVGLLNQQQQPDYAVMQGVMRYMTQFPDRLHHPKEDLLFEKIVLRDPAAAASVDELLAAHKDIIAKGATLLALIEKSQTHPAEADTFKLRKAAHAYIGALRRHMDAEMLHMFPRAQQVLKPEDWIDVDRRMKPILDPVFEAEGNAEFAALRESEQFRPEPVGPGALGTGLIEAAALIEATAALIAGATKSGQNLAQHQRDAWRINLELMRGLLKLQPLDKRLRAATELCERNLAMAAGINTRMLDLWSDAFKAAWRPYDDDGPFAPKLLRLPRRRARGGARTGR